jgi:hypothetical protein
MKVTFEEHGGCFSIDLTPESAREVMDLTRLGMLTTKELRHLSVQVPVAQRQPAQQREMNAQIVLGKSKKDTDTVPRIR